MSGVTNIAINSGQDFTNFKNVQLQTSAAGITNITSTRGVGETIIRIDGTFANAPTIFSIKDGVDALRVNSGIFVNQFPTGTPTEGDTVLNVIDGTVSTFTNGAWVVTPYIPPTGGGVSTPPVAIVTSLPAIATNGEIVYNSSDGKMYVRLAGVWTPYFETLTATASSGATIAVVSTLPTTPTPTEGQTVYNNVDKKLYQYTLGAWVQVVEPTTAAATVAAGSLTTAAFATGLTGVEIVTTLPVTGNFAGRCVYLTTDSKLYRYNGTVFTSSTQASDMLGTITSTQIGANSVTAGAIAANAVTAGTIAVGAVTAGTIAASAITTGTIAAGAITATEIATGAINATKLAAGSVTAGSIATNAIDATKIVAGSISSALISADAINAGHIQAGAITASELSVGAVTANAIAANAITAVAISAGSIGTTQLTANAVTATNIQAGTITANKIVAGDIAVVTHVGSFGFLNTVTAFGSSLTYTNTEQMLSIIVPNANSVPLKILISVQGRTGWGGSDGSFNMALFNGTINVGEYGWSPASQDARCGQTSFTVAANSSATISLRGCKSASAITQSYSMNMAIYGARN